jgi:hypothetical protein
MNPTTLTPMMKKLQLAWRNWRVRHVGKALRTLTKAMHEDPHYAWSWHCNIMMPIYDEAKGKLTREEADAISKKLTNHLFNFTSNTPSSITTKPL